MTVIRRNQPSYRNYQNPNTTNTDGNSENEESLRLADISLASDTESLVNEPVRVHRRPRPRPSKVPQAEDLLVLKKSLGRKKLRRYQNRSMLQRLDEENENETDIVEPLKTPLTRLLEDNNALQYWNEFMDKSEEDQLKIIEEFSQTIKRDVINHHDKTERVDKSYKRIPSRIRHTIKKNVSLDIIKKCEEEFIKFFRETPDEVIVKICNTYLEKMLVYAVALYHRLSSESVPAENKRVVNVCNPLSSEWTPTDGFLTDFIARLKQLN